MRTVCLAVTLAAVVACGSPDASSAQAPGPASRPAADYPAAYRTLKLPEIDGGTVTDAGRQSSSLRDGLAITVTSSKSVGDARTFYTEALTKAGWTSAAPGRGASVPNLPVAMVSFTKDALTFSATITAMAGGTRIELRVLER